MAHTKHARPSRNKSAPRIGMVRYHLDKNYSNSTQTQFNKLICLAFVDKWVVVKYISKYGVTNPGDITPFCIPLREWNQFYTSQDHSTILKADTLKNRNRVDAEEE